MTITRDAALGSNSVNGPASVTITTAAAAAAGSRVVVVSSYFQNTPFSNPTCTVGGTAATLEKIVSNGLERFAVFWRDVAGGLASGSSIVVTEQGAGGGGGLLATACSYLGITGVDTTSSATGTGTSHSSGSATNAVADSLFVGGAGNETAASTTSSPTNGTERFDIWNAAAGQGMTMLDLISTSIGAQALTGTWSTSSTATTGALVIFSGTAGGGGAQQQSLQLTGVGA